MKKYVSYLFVAITFTIIGYFSKSSFPDKGLHCPHTEPLVNYCSNERTEHLDIQKFPEKKNQKALNSYQSKILEYSINEISDNELLQKLNSLFPTGNIDENITDIKKFAHRLLEEVNTSDTEKHPDSFATISFSLSKDTPLNSTYSFTVSEKQIIYAHIDIKGGLGLNKSKFFVKWRNADTNELLLFSPKSINPNTERNWVSLIPEKTWGNQNYEVSFYEYTSTLNKIASETYTTFRN